MMKEGAEMTYDLPQFTMDYLIPFSSCLGLLALVFNDRPPLRLTVRLYEIMPDNPWPQDGLSLSLIPYKCTILSIHH